MNYQQTGLFFQLFLNDFIIAAQVSSKAKYKTSKVRVISNKALKWSLERFFYRLMPESSSLYLWMTKKVDPIVIGVELSDAARCFLEKHSKICLHIECSELFTK